MFLKKLKYSGHGKQFAYTPPTYLSIHKMQSTVPLLADISLEFDDTIVKCPEPIISADNEFGVLTVKSQAPHYGEAATQLFIEFSIDCSASMSDLCRDGRTKMHHVLFTMENIAKKLHRYGEPRIYIHVQAFDNEVVEVISASKSLCHMNLDEVVSKIQAINSRGATDIGLALQSAHRNIEAFKEQHHSDSVQMVHMMLTDGEITQGITDADELMQFVHTNCSMVCIGYGYEHDSSLLSHLCARRGDEYRFIDSIERVGFVYGELLCRIMNKVIERPVLHCTNCVAFDFKTNQWGEQLEFGDLLLDQTRTFHIRRSKGQQESVVRLIGTVPHTNESVVVTQNSATSGDLAKYQYRQRTQELLYSANLFIKVKVLCRRNSFMEQQPQEQTNTKEQAHTIQQLTEFLGCLTEYMGSERRADPFWKMLQADICISLRCLNDEYMDSNHANMYVEARQASQGNQFSYMCSQPQNNMSFATHRIPSSSFVRQQCDDNSFRMTAAATIPDQFSAWDEDDIGNFVPPTSQEQEQEQEQEDFISPYASETTTRMMRDISSARQP